MDCKVKGQPSSSGDQIAFETHKTWQFGDSKSLGCGVYELRIDFGPGYRVYYGKIQNQVILLLCAGSKSSQDKDIKMAREYLNEFQTNE